MKRKQSESLLAFKEAGYIARFLHILILAAVVAPGIVFRSRSSVAILTGLWFVLFAVVYLFLKPRRY